MSDADVVIIGAGLSGLMAARALVAGGATVRVLEASDRVGGRTQRREILGDTYDLGGQWLGPGQDRALALAKELGLALFPTYHQGEKILDHAGRLSRYRGDIPSLSLWQLPLLASAIAVCDRLTARVPTLTPAEAAALDAQTLRGFFSRRLRSAAVEGLLDVAVRTIFGAEPAELSLYGFLRYIHAGGGLLKLSGIAEGAQQDRFVDGAGAMAERLAEALAPHVTLRAPVTALAQDESGVTVTAGPQKLRARRAILAVPPTLAGRITYTPALPAARDALTQRLPQGATTKVLALYDRPFWRAAGLSGEVVATGGFPFSAVFDNSPARGPRGALLGFCVGSAAWRFAALPPQDRRRQSLVAFARWFGPAAAEPLHYEEKDWSEEPYTRGCPSAFAGPEVMTTLGAALRAPIGRLHFAGTETADRWIGYMDGALTAGERAAAEVLRALSTQEPPR